jgi:hypothetical protein
MNNNIPQRLKELSKQIELLSVDVAAMKQYTNDEDDKKDIQELSDDLFHIKSKMACEYYALAEALFE